MLYTLEKVILSKSFSKFFFANKFNYAEIICENFQAEILFPKPSCIPEELGNGVLLGDGYPMGAKVGETGSKDHPARFIMPA